MKEEADTFCCCLLVDGLLLLSSCFLFSKSFDILNAFIGEMAFPSNSGGSTISPLSVALKLYRVDNIVTGFSLGIGVVSIIGLLAYK